MDDVVWTGGRGVGVSPVAASGGDLEPWIALQLQIYGVQAGVGRLWLEAEDVAVGYVIGDGGQVAFETFGVGEFEVLAAGEVGDGLGDVAAQAVRGGDGGHFGERQRRQKLGEAVVGLDGFVVSRVRVRIGIFAHASVRWVGVVVLHPQAARLGGELAGRVVRCLGLSG